MTSSRAGSRAAAVPAPVLVVAAIGSVQLGAAVATSLFAAVGPGGTVLLRLGLSAAVLLPLVRPRLRTYDRAALRAAVVFGLVLAAMNLSFYAALDRIPLGAAVTIEFVGPLAVAVAGSRRLLDGLWVVLAGAGVLLLTSGGAVADATGVGLAALAGVFWAGYIFASQRVGRLIPGSAGLALALGVGAVALLPVGVRAGGSALLQPRVLAAGLAVALLSSAVPYSLELAALRRLSTGVFGVLMSLEPAMAALVGFVVLHQMLRTTEVVGIGCVSAASAGVTLARRAPARRRRGHRPPGAPGRAEVADPAPVP